jgi:predicted Zn-dependent peptidase
MRVYKKQFKNGLRLITVPIRNSLTSTVLVMVEAGSKYEKKSENGISHFLEHMCFKGTSKRPKALDISREFDSIGAEHNAFTWLEFTGYHAKARSRHTKKLVELVSDLYLNPLFPEQEIEKEKGVIIQEINMYEDHPSRNVWKLFYKLLYGNQPAGRTVLGDRKVVLGAKKKDFLDYRRKHYLASSTIVVVAGDVNRKEAEKWVKESFSSIATGQKSKKLNVDDRQKSPQVVTRRKKTDQAHLVLGFRAYSVKNKKLPAAQVMSAILGGGKSSRLFQRLREDMGACYYVRSWGGEYTDHGYLAIHAGVDSKRLQEVIQAILDEIRRIKTFPVTPTELSTAKESIVGSLVMDLESSNDIAEFFGAQEILKREIETPNEVERKIRAVTDRQVVGVARDIFRNNTLNLAVIGNISERAGKKLKASLKL